MMSSTQYILDSDFESFDEGTEFIQTATYGEGQIDDAKLEVSDTYSTKSITVTEEQIEEFFTVVN